MAYNLWFSEKYADLHAGDEIAEDWMGNPKWTDKGYAIAVDKTGNLVQFMDANERTESALQQTDRNAYITASSMHKDDFSILVNRSGEINKAFAKELDIRPDIETIALLTINFHAPKARKIKQSRKTTVTLKSNKLFK